MAKVLRLVNGIQRSVTVDAEVSVSNAASSAVVTFPGTLQGATSTPRIVCVLFDSTDASPQFQPVTVTARSSTGFTATWNAPTDSANYKLLYIVLDGWIV